MSSSTVTYTSISSDYEEPSDAGSLGVVVYRYDGLPMHLVDPYVKATLQAPEQEPPSPDYVPGPEHPSSPDYVPGPEYPEYLVPSDTEAPMEDQPLPDDASPAALSPGYIQSCLHRQLPTHSYLVITRSHQTQAPEQEPPSLDYVPGPEHPSSPDYVPGPEYPEYLVPSDIEAPMEDQPLPDDASHAALSPGYIADFDPEEDPEEDPADYPADGGEDDDESFDDDDDDDDGDDVEDDEEEHLAPADSSAVLFIDHVPSAEDTEAFETDKSAHTPVPSPRRYTARMSVRPLIPMSDTAKALIAEYASSPTPPSPPPSPLSLLSSPLP
ncbi:hypothetical protein Tco_0752894 [Tanacetum coccineum]